MTKRVKLQDIMQSLAEINNNDIKLLRDPDVIRWLFGVTTFLSEIKKTSNKTNDCEKLKRLEDEWGWNKYNDLVNPEKEISKKQWTTLFGQRIAKEIYLINKDIVKKPKKVNKMEPDLETEDNIIEVKTQTFYTSGTAGEKILGSAFKYASIPVLYSKPLIILCIGGAEKICKEQYGNLGDKGSEEQRKMLEIWKTEFKISYKAATTELIRAITVN
jgi:hypothetical protein